MIVYGFYQDYSSYNVQNLSFLFIAVIIQAQKFSPEVMDLHAYKEKLMEKKKWISKTICKFMYVYMYIENYKKSTKNY